MAVSRASEDKQAKSNHGTIRNLIANMIVGVTQGYQKELEIQAWGSAPTCRPETGDVARLFASGGYEVPRGWTSK